MEHLVTNHRDEPHGRASDTWVLTIPKHSKVYHTHLIALPYPIGWWAGWAGWAGHTVGVAPASSAAGLENCPFEM